MTEQDRIAEVFRNRTVFITGGTGFLGKVLIEKLLRSCKVKRVYLLVRSKKGKTSQERLDDIFNNMLFTHLKSQDSTCLTRCKVICGDIVQENLGISSDDRQLLQDEVEFIFHSAASTRFDDSVETAVKFNTRSTKDLLDLAQKCKKLQVFVHISTAYAFPEEKVLYEKAYPSPRDPDEVLDCLKYGKSADVEALLGSSPNTYTFSKALAEEVVLRKMENLPAIIVRPSVVCPTWREPLKGWCNNLHGPMGLFVGAGKGIIRSMYMKGDSGADFIPADIAINGFLVSTWNFLKNCNEDRIINVASSYKINWEEIINIGKKIIYNDVPFNGVVWYPGGSIKKSRLVHNICFYLFQLLPAIFIDLLLTILGYKPVLYQIQRRIQAGSDVFEYYTTKAWDFSNQKIAKMRERMNQKEMEIYKVDNKDFDVKEYLTNCMWCVRRNNLKESDETFPAAKRHMKVMWTVDVICKVGFVLILFYYGYQLILKPLFLN